MKQLLNNPNEFLVLVTKLILAGFYSIGDKFLIVGGWMLHVLNFSSGLPSAKLVEAFLLFAYGGQENIWPN